MTSYFLIFKFLVLKMKMKNCIFSIFVFGLANMWKLNQNNYEILLETNDKKVQW